MPIQQMEYFLSVATLLSFNKAARVNYVSPSTITRQIAALELELFDFARLWSIRLKDDPITTDYMLFWKKGNRDPDLARFLTLADYDPDAV